MLYNYYRKNRNTRIPYFSAIASLFVCVFFNFLTILLFTNIDINKILPWSTNEPYGVQFIKASAFVLPFILFLTIYFRKEKVINLNLEERVIKRGNKILLVYIIGSYILFFILAFIFKA